MTAASARNADRTGVFPLIKSGAGASLVFLPDIGGNLLYAKKLAGALQSDVASYGARLPPKLVRDLHSLSLPEIADRLADQIEAYDFPGVTHLCGHSFAGLLAFETARAMARREATPTSVVLLDIPSPHRKTGFGLAAAEQRLKYAAYGLKDRFDLWRGALEPGRILHEFGFVRMDLRRHPESYREIIRGLYRAMADYAPASYDGPVLVVRATSAPDAASGPADLGWGELAAGGARTFDVAADHLGIVHDDAAIAETAAFLSCALNARAPVEALAALEEAF